MKDKKLKGCADKQLNNFADEQFLLQLTEGVQPKPKAKRKTFALRLASSLAVVVVACVVAVTVMFPPAGKADPGLDSSAPDCSDPSIDGDEKPVEIGFVNQLLDGACFVESQPWCITECEKQTANGTETFIQLDLDCGSGKVTIVLDTLALIQGETHLLTMQTTVGEFRYNAISKQQTTTLSGVIQLESGQLLWLSYIHGGESSELEDVELAFTETLETLIKAV